MAILNKRCHYEYFLMERLKAGVVLDGAEVRSVRQGRMILDEAFVKIINNEAFLLNALIPPPQNITGYDPTRTRKLLLQKKEILNISAKIRQGDLTLIPTACYNSGKHIKIEIALAKRKRKWEKQAYLKQKTEIERS